VYDDFFRDWKRVPYILTFIPSTLNTIYILIFTKIYKPVVGYLVDIENHRFTNTYENSLIGKLIMFQFVNAYISNFIHAFYFNDFYKLAKNLGTILILKQVFSNTVEYYSDKYFISRKLKKVDQEFDYQINEEENEI